MLTREQIAFIIAKHKADDIQSGEYAEYIKINRNMGVKLFDTIKKRDRAFVFQLHAANHGLAPLIASPFYIQTIQRYCFLTEHVRVSVIYKTSSYEACSKIRERLRDIGIRWEDEHIGNIGILRGKVVMIDFSDDLVSNIK